ncbi:MAG: hypothetical protein H7836_01350 [Magnetococcus sp. YQC-3]
MTLMTPLLRLLLALGLLLVGTLAANAADKPALQQIPAADCGECHQEIYQQWQKSMHANSTALKDPIHGAMYKMMVGEPTQEGVQDKNGKYPVCLQCHAPIAAQDGKTKLDAQPNYADGVTCVACHTMTRFSGTKGADGGQRVGAKAYEFSAEALQGGNGAWHGKEAAIPPGSGKNEPTANPFPHAANPELFKSSDACLGCHEQLKNAHGVAVCTIGDILTGKGPVPTCQSCHMPVVNGQTSHALAGGHDPAQLRRGVILTVAAKKNEKGVEATVNMQNKLAHTYPTGAPFRNLILKVTALDAAGQVLWQNFKENPMAEDPQAVLMLKLTDDEGKPTMPMMASKLAGDSRLQPGETRTLTYPISTQGVAVVRAELLYNLVSKMMVEKMGDKLPDAAKKPTMVGRAEAKL